MTVLTQQSPPISQSIDVYPGKIVDVEINFPVKLRIKVPIIGYEMGKYIILKSPVSSKISDYNDVLVEGNVVIVRYILEGERGECCAFRSTIKHITKYPENFIILHYPPKIESRQLRLQQRITTHLPASIMLDSETGTQDKLCLNGIIADISTRGCGFAFKADNTTLMLNKQDILICIHHPTTGQFKISARVCNSRNEQGKVSIGVKFLDNEQQVESLLECLFIDRNMH
jgi:c-di-GMP-binding flagellar brake protein YcgR